jgi:hypothetical protein
VFKSNSATSAYFAHVGSGFHGMPVQVPIPVIVNACRNSTSSLAKPLRSFTIHREFGVLEKLSMALSTVHDELEFVFTLLWKPWIPWAGMRIQADAGGGTVPAVVWARQGLGGRKWTKSCIFLRLLDPDVYQACFFHRRRRRAVCRRQESTPDVVRGRDDAIGGSRVKVLEPLGWQLMGSPDLWRLGAPIREQQSRTALDLWANWQS